MAYCIGQPRSKFRIRKQHFTAALKAIKGLAGKETIRNWGEPQFAWVRTHDFLCAETLEVALLVWRWSPLTAGEAQDPHCCLAHPPAGYTPEADPEDIIDLAFIGDKLGDEELLFGALAPYVEPGSYLEMVAENGAHWRWYFDGSRCVRKEARIIWDEEAA